MRSFRTEPPQNATFARSLEDVPGFLLSLVAQERNSAERKRGRRRAFAIMRPRNKHDLTWNTAYKSITSGNKTRSGNYKQGQRRFWGGLRSTPEGPAEVLSLRHHNINILQTRGTTSLPFRAEGDVMERV